MTSTKMRVFIIDGKRVYGELVDYHVEKPGQWAKLRIANGDCVKVIFTDRQVYRLYDKNNKPLMDENGNPEYYVTGEVNSIGSDLL